MAGRRTHPPLKEWDYADPRPLEARVQQAVAEFGPDAVSMRWR